MLACLAVPAQAQNFSDGYTFLKAVKDRDGDKATELIVAPGSIVINTREPGSGNTALHMLTRDRDMTWLSFMLSKGARPDVQNKEGLTPLAVAAQIGWVEGADRLIRGGANVDIGNNQGDTPLILAVQNRDLPMVRTLLGHGADPNKQDKAAGLSAIDYAKRDGRMPAILKLLEDKAAGASASK